MTIFARFAVSIALLFAVCLSSQAQAFEWPHPFGHDIEGSIGSRISPFGGVELLADSSNRDDDGDEGSRGILAALNLGADFAITDRLSIRVEGRTGDDHRTGYLSLGGDNFDQNFDVSLSQLYVDWRVPNRFGLADNVDFRFGRQPIRFVTNELYSGTVIDEDLNLDGLQLNWDCGCEDWDVETGGSVGGWKLNNFGMVPAAGPDFSFPTQDYETETARLLTADLHSTWTPNEDLRFQTYLNYYHYSNSDDGFGGNDDSADQEAGIVDSPDILQAGINTRFGLGDTGLHLTAEYIHNLDANSDEDGFTAGIGVDIMACDRPHRFSYVYQDIGALSVVPSLVQDDHRDARSGYRGHVVQGEWNTTDRVRLLVEGFIADTDNDSPIDSDAWRVRAGLRVQFN